MRNSLFAAGLAVALALSPNAETAEEQASKLSVVAPDGASIEVDGTFVGIAPLPESVRVGAGKRVVSVTLLGHHAHTEEVVLRPDTTKVLTVDLCSTRQRKLSIALLSVGGAGLLTGAVLGVLSVVADRRAAGGSGLSREERDAVVTESDDYRVGSGIAAGLGFAVFLAGGALYVLDKPERPVFPRAISIRPLISPTGIAVTVAF